VVSLEGDDYLSGSEIWPDKRGGLKRGINVTTNQNYIKSTIQLVFNSTFNIIHYFSYIMVVRFKGGGNRSTRREPPTCRKSLTNYENNTLA
jgi:hypothetical protein